MTIEFYQVDPASADGVGGRADWLALRARDLTMSDIGGVIGVDRFKTPFDIWAWKAGLAEPPQENAAMRLGRWAEPAVACALSEQYPGSLEIEYPLKLYVRDSELRLGGTPDATALGGNVVLEFKVISRQSYERNWPDGVPPLKYQLQTLGNAMLLDARYGILAALVLGWQEAEIVVREIPRHAGAEAKIRDIARNFWAAFDAGHAPQPDYERDAATIRQVFRPDPDKPALDLGQDNRIYKLLERRETLNENVRREKADLEAIKAEIITKLDGAELAIADGWKITQRAVHVAERMAAAYDYTDLRATRTKEKAA